MSRVPADTVLIRLALVAAVALPLSGCGGDDKESASTPATPAASTPAEVAPSSATPAESTPASKKGKEESKSEPSAISVAGANDPNAQATEEDYQKVKKAAEEAAKTASPAKVSNDELAQQMKRAFDALKKEGLDPGKPISSGEDSGALTIKDTTVAFFLSPQRAAAAAASLESAFKASPAHIKVARRANRLFLLSLPSEPTAEQIANYQKVRKIVNGAA